MMMSAGPDEECTAENESSAPFALQWYLHTDCTTDDRVLIGTDDRHGIVMLCCGATAAWKAEDGKVLIEKLIWRKLKEICCIYCFIHPAPTL